MSWLLSVSHAVRRLFDRLMTPCFDSCGEDWLQVICLNVSHLVCSSYCNAMQSYFLALGKLGLVAKQMHLSPLAIAEGWPLFCRNASARWTVSLLLILLLLRLPASFSPAFSLTGSSCLLRGISSLCQARFGELGAHVRNILVIEHHACRMSSSLEAPKDSVSSSQTSLPSVAEMSR